uniref:PTPRJ transmembrane domain-containing protein n=1 Tax=Biomphalaria glabrata TaxID=6526 RepID=A0A2C9KGD1_BIOGL
MKTAAPTFKANYDAESSKPYTVSDKTLPGITQNQISFQLKNPFSPDNGQIKYYTVIASLDPSVLDKDSLLPSWLDVQKNSNLKFYLAANCTDLFARESACEALSGSRHRRDTGELDSQTFVLGGETSTSCINRPFCNGPLTPGTEYAIKLRGYTASGQYQETAYSDKVKTTNVILEIKPRKVRCIKGRVDWRSGRRHLHTDHSDHYCCIAGEENQKPAKESCEIFSTKATLEALSNESAKPSSETCGFSNSCPKDVI